MINLSYDYSLRLQYDKYCSREQQPGLTLDKARSFLANKDGQTEKSMYNTLMALQQRGLHCTVHFNQKNLSQDRDMRIVARQDINGSNYYVHLDFGFYSQLLRIVSVLPDTFTDLLQKPAADLCLHITGALPGFSFFLNPCNHRITLHHAHVMADTVLSQAQAGYYIDEAFHLLRMYAPAFTDLSKRNIPKVSPYTKPFRQRLSCQHPPLTPHEIFIKQHQKTQPGVTSQSIETILRLPKLPYRITESNSTEKNPHLIFCKKENRKDAHPEIRLTFDPCEDTLMIDSVWGIVCPADQYEPAKEWIGDMNASNDFFNASINENGVISFRCTVPLEDAPLSEKQAQHLIRIAFLITEEYWYTLYPLCKKWKPDLTQCISSWRWHMHNTVINACKSANRSQTPSEVLEIMRRTIDTRTFAKAFKDTLGFLIAHEWNARVLPEIRCIVIDRQFMKIPFSILLEFDIERNELVLRIPMPTKSLPDRRSNLGLYLDRYNRVIRHGFYDYSPESDTVIYCRILSTKTPLSRQDISLFLVESCTIYEENLKHVSRVMTPQPMNHTLTLKPLSTAAPMDCLN